MAAVAYLPPTSPQTSFPCGFATHSEPDLVLDADTQHSVGETPEFHPTKTWVAGQTKDMIHCGAPTKHVAALGTDYDDNKARKSPSWDTTDSSDEESDEETLSEGDESDESDQPSPLPPPLYGKPTRYNRPVKDMNRVPSPPPCLPDTRPLHRLRLDNSFLLTQNQSLTREIQHSRFTIQALKNIVQHKEDQTTQLQTDLNCAHWRIQVLETMLMRCIGPEEEDESDEKREIRAAWECYESRFLGGWNEEGSRVQESESESEDLEEEEEEEVEEEEEEEEVEDADVNLDVDVEATGEGEDSAEEEEEEEEEYEYSDDEDSFSSHPQFPETSHVNRPQLLDNSSQPFVPQTNSLPQTLMAQQRSSVNNSASRNHDVEEWNGGEKVWN